MKTPEHTLVKTISLGQGTDIIEWDLDIDVWGRYLDYRPATRYDPEEGGYFEVDYFKAKANGVDVSALLEPEDVQRWTNEDCY